MRVRRCALLSLVTLVAAGATSAIGADKNSGYVRLADGHLPGSAEVMVLGRTNTQHSTCETPTCEPQPQSECEPCKDSCLWIKRLFSYTPRPCCGVGRTGSLPVGRRYYRGRFFGNYTNRHYGPQYGNF